MLTQLIYTSRCRIPGGPEELAFVVKSIADVSRYRNMLAGLTGAMMLHNGIFAQVLEGPRHALDHVFERIKRDARHSDIAILAKCGAQARLFSDWSMVLVGAEGASPLRITTAAGASGLDLDSMNGADILHLLQRLSRATTLVAT